MDPDKFLDVLLRRQSDRKYSNRQVEMEKLDRILSAARMSPSACNAQPWKFIVVNDNVLLGRLAEAASAKLIGMNTFAGQAPLMIVIVRESANMTAKIGSTIKDKDYSLIDIGIAAENICLQAEAEGLGSCMIGWFDEMEVRKILGIPGKKRVELIITIGYSLSEKRQKRRKETNEVISFNKY